MNCATRRMVGGGVRSAVVWAVGVLAWACPAPGGDLTIADLAPRGSIMVAGANKAGAMIDAFNRTGLRAMWDDPATREWLKLLGTGAAPGMMEEALEAIGVKMEDLQTPTGAIGAAIWLEDAKEAGKEGRGEGGGRGALLALADFGENAGAMNEVITAALEKASDRKAINLTEENYQGVIVWTIRVEEAEEAEKDGAGEAEEEGLDDEEDEGGLFEEWFGDLGEGPSFFARAGEYLFVSSREEAIKRAVDRALGGKGAPGVEESEEFGAIHRQLGSVQGYAVLMAAPFLEMARLEAEREDGEDSAIGAILPMLDSIGLGEIRAVGAGLRFDGETGMVEAPMAVLAPVKKGLLALVDLSGPFEAPGFIGADAATNTLFRFNFAGLIPLVNQVIASMPPEEVAQAQAMVGALAMTAGPMLANIGPEVYAVTQYERPFTPESTRQFYALTVKDAGVVAQSMAQLQGLLGLESRDFQGNQIWSAGNGMVGAPSLGLGFGRLFIGPPASVENAMRLAGAAEGARLSGEKRYQESTRPLATPGMLFGWTDIAKAADWHEWTTKNIETITRARIAAAFGGEEPADDEERRWRQEAEEDAIKQIPRWVREMPAGELIKKHFGDTLMEMRSTKEGFEGRMIVLRP